MADALALRPERADLIATGLARGMSQRAIARVLRIRRCTIRAYIERYNLLCDDGGGPAGGNVQQTGFGAGRPVNPALDRDTLAGLIDARLSLAEIGRQTGRSVSTVRWHVVRHGLTLPTDGRAGNGRYRRAKPGEGPVPQPMPPALDQGAALTRGGDDRLPPAVLAQLIATGGRWQALAAWAKAQRVPLRQAQTLWHRLRLPPAVAPMDEGAA